jgi:hypothetical protein
MYTGVDGKQICCYGRNPVSATYPIRRVSMRRHLLFAPLVCLLATALAQEPPPGSYSTLPEYKVFGEAASPEDAQAIETLIRHFSEARQAGDAGATAAVYAEDAEWTNAFGDGSFRSSSSKRSDRGILGWSRKKSSRSSSSASGAGHGISMSGFGSTEEGSNCFRYQRSRELRRPPPFFPGLLAEHQPWG